MNRQLPHLGDAGKGVCEAWNEHLRGYMRRLADALRTTRVVCGDWERAVSPSITTRHGVTAVLLDPPYGEGSMEYSGGGNTESMIANAVWEWACANGSNQLLKIAVCGYEDGRIIPTGWKAMRWKTHPGYRKPVTDSENNHHREVVWFSPNCAP